MRGLSEARPAPRVAKLKRLVARAARLASAEGGRLLHALWLLWEVDLRLRLSGFARLWATLHGSGQRSAVSGQPGARRSGPGFPPRHWSEGWDRCPPQGWIAAFALSVGRSPRPALGPLPVEEARRMAQALRRAARYVPRARCLHRSLALLLWLRRRGIGADLRMGVRSAADTIDGHAWVEWQGVLLDDERSYCDTFELLEQREIR